MPFGYQTGNFANVGFQEGTLAYVLALDSLSRFDQPNWQIIVVCQLEWHCGKCSGTQEGTLMQVWY